MANTLGNLAQGTKRVIQSALELSLRRLRSYIDARDADTSAAVNAAERSAKSYTDTKVDDEHVRAHEAEQALQAAISSIDGKIPLQASTQNQLADKEYVNSSISTATATFRGTYNIIDDLGLTTQASKAQVSSALAMKMAALTIVPDTNDYAFIQVPAEDTKPDMIARVDRYKYNGDAWRYEYSLNNSGFTASQWAAINSGITAEEWNITPDFVEEAPEDTELIDHYTQILQELYQGITDVQDATANAKADCIGTDSYVYRWNPSAHGYQRTNIYVKGDPGTTDYRLLQNKPTKLSDFIDDLGNRPRHDHATLVNNGSYNSTTKEIELKHGDAVVATIDATVFIKDGMVDSVTVTDGSLVIVFNTDSGKEPISIPLISIFNPANYYNKTSIDALMALKVNVSDLDNDVELVESEPGTFPF